ncbi:hypothetical protein LZ906_007300 [Paraclostridium ghonii]|uniref:hypothetical protein n=1 Tax=Paraclostridium ghonii TaxID=29358 RepID=UPI00202CE591|nr:hypothetical protein [Paeniclostridium ghonii]MCM0166187.1 hypothetical protein [Paeniclostridium ghonii]
MKKKICSLFFIFFMLPVNIFASELNLDPDVLKNKNETSASITDIYKIPVFSNKYKEYIEKKDREKESEKNNILENLFDNAQIKSINSRTNEKEALFKESKVVKNSTETNKISKIIPILGMISFFLFSVAIVLTTNLYYKNKKDKDDINVHYNNLENK